MLPSLLRLYVGRKVDLLAYGWRLRCTLVRSS
jgi:hypothetical protein